MGKARMPGKLTKLLKEQPILTLTCQRPSYLRSSFASNILFSAGGTCLLAEYITCHKLPGAYEEVMLDIACTLNRVYSDTV